MHEYKFLNEVSGVFDEATLDAVFRFQLDLSLVEKKRILAQECMVRELLTLLKDNFRSFDSDNFSRRKADGELC